METGDSGTSTPGPEGTPPGELPRALLSALELAGEGRQRRDVARDRLDAAARLFGEEARRTGLTPESMLVLLKRCLNASRMRLRRADHVQVRERLVEVALDAYFEPGPSGEPDR